MTAPSELEPWALHLAKVLDLGEQTIDIEAILGMTASVAHAVARPAAPLSAYMCGLAVARGQDFAAVMADVERAAQAWQEPKS